MSTAQYLAALEKLRDAVLEVYAKSGANRTQWAEIRSLAHRAKGPVCVDDEKRSIALEALGRAAMRCQKALADGEPAWLAVPTIFDAIEDYAHTFSQSAKKSFLCVCGGPKSEHYAESMRSVKRKKTYCHHGPPGTNCTCTQFRPVPAKKRRRV